jgi:outer membrane protein W
MKTRKFAIVTCAVALILSGLVSPVAAEKGDKQIRFGVLYSTPTDDLVVGTQTTELDAALGFGASFECQFSDLLGIEGGVDFIGYDLTVTQPMFPVLNGDTDLMSLTVNLNFHFEKDSGLDLILGPTIGYAFWDDINVDTFPPTSTDDDFLFGAHFGVDYPFGEAWSFYGDLSYLAIDIAPSAPIAPTGDIGVSPFQLEIGLGYTF